MWWTREKLAETVEFAREAKALRRDYFNGCDSKEEVLTNYENYLAERLTLLQKARYVFSCIEELNEKLVNLEEIINNEGKQRFQITKTRQKLFEKIFWNWMVTFVLATIWQLLKMQCVQSPETEIMQICWNNIRWTYFLAGFSHLKPLCGSEKTADENLEACLIVTDKMALEANEVADTIILQGISYWNVLFKLTLTDRNM